jgi:hypothetical protein
MTIRTTLNQGIQSNLKHYEVPAAPQTGLRGRGESREWIQTSAAAAGAEMRDIDTRDLTSQSPVPSDRHNGPVE